ncbi:hypothetical protein HK105_207027 [Polyrhizophydium stewartii]|uniref:Elongation factor P n=1 Tax=Polyrhizophydium stewartii TaxID=2732419 RepID=A0ABR4N1M9_9FUNG|nr:hypothetical protein HK105_004809 [Polyrhizophydium stewartii]
MFARPLLAAAAAARPAWAPARAAAAATPRLLLRRGLLTEINQARKGQVISLKGKLWAILSNSHHRQGRGGAHYKLELKELLSGSKGFERLNSGTTVDVVTLEQRDFQFMYADDVLHVLHPETLEEHEFPTSLLAAGEKVVPLLQDSMNIKVEFHENKPVLIKVPERGTFTVTDASMAAQSASDNGKGTVYKQATLDNGVSLSVPDFVNIGDQIVVDLLEQTYHSRAKE